MGQEEEIPIRDLLQLCLRSDDEQHWQELVRRTQPLIATVILNTCRRWREPGHSLVDDLIQDTYVKLFDKDKKAFRSLRSEFENAVFAFLKITASRVVLDHFRQPKNQIDEIEVSDLALPSPDIKGKIRFAQTKDEIQRQLEKLSSTPTYQRDVTVFWLHYEQGYTAKEVSLLPGIGLKEKGVEALLFRLIRYLREQFGETDSEAKSESG